MQRQRRGIVIEAPARSGIRGTRGLRLVAASVFSFGLSFLLGALDAVAEPSAADSAAGAGGAARLEGEVGAAGRVVDRFTPPVAAPIAAANLGAPRALERGALVRPCDSPGSGCRNPAPSTPQIVTPPIVPGTRPPRTPQ